MSPSFDMCVVKADGGELYMPMYSQKARIARSISDDV